MPVALLTNKPFTSYVKANSGISTIYFVKDIANETLSLFIIYRRS